MSDARAADETRAGGDDAESGSDARDTRGDRLVILASAGTGKTYQLTNRYLSLLARGVPTEAVLATTFTRKAAGEILERVLARLVAGATSDAGARALSAAVDARQFDRDAWRRLLVAFARDIDRCQVRTIDSWFVHLAMLFGLEAGLPAGWRLAEKADQGLLADAAVARVLREAPVHEIHELIHALKKEGAGLVRNVHQALRTVVGDAHELFRVSTPEAWDGPSGGRLLDEAGLAAALAAVGAIDIPLTKTGTPRKHWVDNVAHIVDDVTAEHWDGFLERGLVKKVLAGEEVFASAPIDEDVQQIVLRLVAHATHHVLAKVARTTRAYRDLLERFDLAHQAVKGAARTFEFSDLPRLVLDALGGSRGGVADAEQQERLAHAVAFRMDGRVEHLLLDEFQDTSLVQWQAVEPLAVRAIASAVEQRGGSFFCVGDGKQSIYGWRGGESSMLAELTGHFAGLHEERLGKSWRSSKVVLDAVNRVFAGIVENDALADEPPLREGARLWHRAWETHVAEKSLSGAVTLRAVDTSTGHEAILRRCAEHVARLAREAPHASIGVLVRRNRPIPYLIHQLRLLGVHASGEGGTPLTDAESVQLALSLLVLADHPGDAAARFHLATSCLAVALRLDPERDDEHDPEVAFATNDERGAGAGTDTDVASAPDRQWTRDVSRRARALARAWRRRLVERGYGASLAALGRQIEAAPSLGSLDRRRFAQLVDLAYAWDARASLRPSDFVEFVRSESVEDPSRARVKVMTVHGSKGLEFDAVCLPELEVTSFKRASGLLGRRPSPWKGVDLVVARAERGLASLDAEIAGLVDSETARQVEQELCVLYVAMTRAIHRLDLFVAASPRGHRTFAAVLRAALPGVPDEDGVVYTQEGSRDDWFADIEVKAGTGAGAGAGAGTGTETETGAETGTGAGTEADTDTDTESDTDTDTDTEAAFRAGQLELFGGTRVTRAAPSALEGGAWVRPRELLRSFPKEARAHGSLLHLFYEQVSWIDAPIPDDASLRRLARERLGTGPRDPLLTQALDAFRAQLAAPGVRACLTRPEGAHALWRERPFLVRTSPQAGRARLLRGVFDRVVLHGDPAAPTSAEIIDFKSDSGDGLAARVETYRPQLESYRAALAAMTGLAPDAIRCALLFVGADELREI